MLDAIESTYFYLKRLFDEVKGPKILLVDDDTISVVSVVLSQTELLKFEIFLTDKISTQNRNNIDHYNCIIFVRPTKQNYQLITQELQNKLYKNYYLCFSNFVERRDLEMLASADMQSKRVKEVFLYFADYIPLDTFHVTLNLQNAKQMIAIYNGDTRNIYFDRITEAIMATCLSMKRKPYILYQSESNICKLVSKHIAEKMDEEKELFAFASNPHLVILDRRMDCVTPLLIPWTYQAMIHEFLNLMNNTATLTTLTPQGEEKKDQFLLDPQHDMFYKDNMYQLWGSVLTNVVELVNKYTASSDVKSKLKSIEEIQKFMATEMSDYKKLSDTVAKHMQMITFMKDETKKRSVLEISQLEQSIQETRNSKAHLTTFTNLMPKMNKKDALRVAVLYSLYYSSTKLEDVVALKKALETILKFTKEELKLIDFVSEFADSKLSAEPLIRESLKSLRSKASVQNFFGVNQSEQDTFITHKPYLYFVLQKLFTPTTNFWNNFFSFQSASTREIPKEMILFVIGGVTFEEVRIVNQFNQDAQNQKLNRRVILGGTNMINSEQFIRQMKQMMHSNEEIDL